MNKELKQLQKHVDEHDAKRKKVLRYAKDVFNRLPDDTDIVAEFLAIICHKTNCSELILDWMLDYYMALEFEQYYYPWMQKIHKYLIKHKHNERNKFDYFNDCEAFYLDKERFIFVCGTFREPRYLVINEDFTILDNKRNCCWVRKIWRKTRLNCIKNVDQPTLKHYRDVKFDMCFSDGKFRIYGDARDHGHVLTYQNRFGSSKCDKVSWNIGEHTRFFFEINSLLTQIENQ